MTKINTAEIQCDAKRAALDTCLSLQQRKRPKSHTLMVPAAVLEKSAPMPDIA